MGTVVELTQARLDAASAAHEDAERERKRKESALKLAKSRAKRLAKETKRARRLSEAVGQDRADAENELAEHVQTREKRQSKLAKAEAALAAAQATQDVEQAAAKKTTTARKRTASATKKTVAPRKRTSAQKTAAKRTRCQANDEEDHGLTRRFAVDLVPGKEAFSQEGRVRTPRAPSGRT